MKSKIDIVTYILISFVVVLFLTGAIIDIKHGKKLLDNQIKFLEKSIKNEYKKRLEESVDSTINYIDSVYKHSLEEHSSLHSVEQNVREYLYKNIHDTTRYTWINKIVNFDGGDDYAIRLIHPNLKDSEGIYLSTKATDIKGNHPYLEELNGVKKDGELYFTYFFKQLDSDVITEKLSYAKLYKELDWVIATGIAINSLNQIILEEKKKYLKEYEEFYYIKISVIIFLLIVLIIIILWLKRMVYHLIQENMKEKDQTILQQARLASLGSMINNIIHQFKQPLSSISTVGTAIKLEKEEKMLDDEKLDSYADNIVNSVSYMAQTMETFRNFTKRDKEYKLISIQSEIEKAKIITQGMMIDNNILLKDDVDYENVIKIELVEGELLQVIVNLINNAKDLFKEKNIEKPWIKINLEEKQDMIIITVEDNAGGVDEEIRKKIFDPYFTTKSSKEGSGLGLHMSKNIVESLGGEISVKNASDGAKFIILLFK